ncbi:Carboxylesterase type B [Geosmithia morbida]|uniref:Carboxylic ester hydrolase n=1 Tax=Geosmithia morbida TaxID=1094350 RepID=A0A9P4Z1G5_9HYPO|nr:Carboxylesterase type B [Geosmithia morbida]KAF4126953.1 Carboxylesterase type B [Geosmithia morbida]
MKLSDASQAAGAALLVLATGAESYRIPHGSSATPKVKVLNGTYSGVHSSEYDQDFFLGIPYAQPPVGDLRLRVPQPLNSTWNGTREAAEYSPQCYGYGSDTWVLGNYVSEDCLTINVVRPSGVATDHLPVALWIHGGGFTNGGSSDPRYNLSFIVEESVRAGSPIIATSINYRLHNWGFLHSDALVAEGSTNLGFRDQRLALHWVRENIAAFGGDPERVTIWGESAGAYSVGAQLIAYGGRDDGLFHGAILESGSPLPLGYEAGTTESWQPYYDALLDAAGCAGTAGGDSLACLRAIPAEELSSVFNSSFADAPSYGQVVDGDFFVATGDQQLREGRFVKVPTISGTNFDEGSIYGPLGVNTTEQFRELLAARGLNDSVIADVEVLYPDDPALGLPATFEGRPTGIYANYGAQWKRLVAFLGDAAFQAPRRLTTRSFADEGVPIWSYHWNVLVKGIAPPAGVTHFQEVVFVFHNVDGLGYDTAVATNPLAGKPEELIKLADIMSKQWISFIAHGDPNYHGKALHFLASLCTSGHPHTPPSPHLFLNPLLISSSSLYFFLSSSSVLLTTLRIDESLYWPKYTARKPLNLVYDVNVTHSGYAEKDTYREKEIDYIIDTILV